MRVFQLCPVLICAAVISCTAGSDKSSTSEHLDNRLSRPDDSLLWKSTPADALRFVSTTADFLETVPDSQVKPLLLPFLRDTGKAVNQLKITASDIRAVLSRDVSTVSIKGNRYILFPWGSDPDSDDAGIPQWPLILYFNDGVFKISLAGSVDYKRPPSVDPDPRNIELSAAEAFNGIPGKGESLIVRFAFSTGDILECRLLNKSAPLNTAAFVSMARGLRNIRTVSDDPSDGEAPGARWVKYPFYKGRTVMRVLGSRAIGIKDLSDDSPGFAIPDEFDLNLRHDSAGLITTLPQRADVGRGAFAITGYPIREHDDVGSIFGRCDPDATLKIFKKKNAANIAHMKFSLSDVSFFWK